MLAQDIGTVGHRSHDVHQSGTVGAEVFEDIAQQVQVALLVHALKDFDNGIHRLALVVILLDSALGHAERTLNQVVLTLDRSKQFVEGRS